MSKHGRTPEEIRAGWAANLANEPLSDKPKPRKVHPLYASEPVAWKKFIPLILFLAFLSVGGGLLAWLVSHDWKF